MKVTSGMVDRFLAWELPESVLPDACVMDRAYLHRSGTNLLTAVEARAMLEHILGAEPALLPEERAIPVIVRALEGIDAPDASGGSGAINLRATFIYDALKGVATMGEAYYEE